MSKRNILFIVLILIISVIVGFFVGKALYDKNNNNDGEIDYNIVDNNEVDNDWKVDEYTYRYYIKEN